MNQGRPGDAYLGSSVHCAGGQGHGQGRVLHPHGAGLSLLGVTAMVSRAADQKECGKMFQDDSFDRIMTAQAKAEGLKFMTHDSKIPFYEESCVMAV